jgi:hypothetical protein
VTLIFPAVIPSSHPVITWGRFPHVSKRSTGGRSEKIRLSNVNIGAEIQLAFKNISTEDLLQLRGHWDLARGTAREFEIHPALLQAMNQASKDRLLATTWKFKDAPQIVDICGGAPGFLLHSLEITLKSQPRRVLSPVSQGAPVVPVVAPGARWALATSWQAGRAGINQLNLPGATWNVRTNWEPGRASITGGATAPGAEWHVSTSWQPGGSTAPGAAWTASTSWAPGAATVTGLAPGAQWNVSTSWTPGAATVPPALRPGAQWNVSTSWTPGGATVQTSAPGAVWNVSTSWTPGAGQVTSNSQTVANNASITIPLSPSLPSNYPSSITVSGISGRTIQSISVKLVNMTFSATPNFVVIGIVGPDGQRAYIMSRPARNAEETNKTLNFADSGSDMPGTSWDNNATYKPYMGVDHGFPSPAPSGTYQQTFSSFIGTNPNGTWNLYAYCVSPFLGNGEIAGGWELTLNLS